MADAKKQDNARRGGSIGFLYLLMVLVTLLIVYLISGVYFIDRNEVGVVTRFGEVVAANVQPGMHVSWPYPIDQVYTVPVKQVETLQVDDFATDRRKKDSRSKRYYTQTRLDPYCITGDNNIVNVELIVKYTISDPVKYLFSTSDVRGLMQNLAAQTLLQSISKTSVDEILTFGKKRLEMDVERKLQERLDGFDTGIGVSFIEIKEIRPPSRIQPDFDDVINAQVDKKNSVHNAQGYRNRVVPEARSEANRMTSQAESDSLEAVRKAEGETERYLSKLIAYRMARRVNIVQIYLDFVAQLGPRVKEIRIVDKKRADQHPIYWTPARGK